MKSLFAQMEGVMTLGAQPFHNPEGNPHVGEESHALASGDAHLLLRKPRGVLQRLLDVPGF